MKEKKYFLINTNRAIICPDGKKYNALFGILGDFLHEPEPMVIVEGETETLSIKADNTLCAFSVGDKIQISDSELIYKVK